MSKLFDYTEFLKYTPLNAGKAKVKPTENVNDLLKLAQTYSNDEGLRSESLQIKNPILWNNIANINTFVKENDINPGNVLIPWFVLYEFYKNNCKIDIMPIYSFQEAIKWFFDNNLYAGLKCIKRLFLAGRMNFYLIDRNLNLTEEETIKLYKKYHNDSQQGKKEKKDLKEFIKRKEKKKVTPSNKGRFKSGKNTKSETGTS